MIRLNVTRPWRTFAILGVLGLVFAATACRGGGTKEKATSAPAATATSAASADGIPTLDITAKEYRFDAPASISGGLTRIRLHNAGAEDHQAHLLRLEQGTTFEQLGSAIQAGHTLEGVSLLPPVSLGGGVNTIAPGGTAEVVNDLSPGRYVLLCLVNSRDGKNHGAKGMVRPLEVTAPPATQPPQPEAQATIRMLGYGYDGPDTLPAGKTTIEVVNGEFHEMKVLRLNEGVTADQVRQELDTGGWSPPAVALTYTAAGGMGEVPPSTSWATLDLTPGVYALVCFIIFPPDPSRPEWNSYQTHFARGMFRTFTVQ